MTAGPAGDRAVEVREAEPGDVEPIAGFFAAAWEQAGPAAPGFAGATEDSMRAIRAPRAIRRGIGGPVRRMFLAVLDGTVVGLAATVRVDRRSVELAGLAVLPVHAGRGTGGRLVQAALRSARDGGFQRMTVRTELTNDAALRFYDRHGFAPVGTVVQQVEAGPVPVVLLARDV